MQSCVTRSNSGQPEQWTSCCRFDFPRSPAPRPATHRGHPVGLRRTHREQPAAHQDSGVDGPRPLPRVVRPLPLPRPRTPPPRRFPPRRDSAGVGGEEVIDVGRSKPRTNQCPQRARSQAFITSSISSREPWPIDSIANLRIRRRSRLERAASFKHGDVIWSCVRPNRRSRRAGNAPPTANTIASSGFAVRLRRRFRPRFLCIATIRSRFRYLPSERSPLGQPIPRLLQSTCRKQLICSFRQHRC